MLPVQMLMVASTASVQLDTLEKGRMELAKVLTVRGYRNKYLFVFVSFIVQILMNVRRKQTCVPMIQLLCAQTLMEVTCAAVDLSSLVMDSVVVVCIFPLAITHEYLLFYVPCRSK